MRYPLVTSRAAAAPPQAAARSCGPCTACCVLPRIRPEDFPPDGKPGYSPCPHVCGSGCSVYEDRPDVCRDYVCLWREGLLEGDDRRRPDNLGLMFAVDLFMGRPFVEAWELWDGAARDYPGRGVLDAIRVHKPVLVRYYGVPCSLEYRGPQDLVTGRELSRLAREDPPALAEWLEERIRRADLEDPDQATVEMDLARLREGKRVPLSLFPRR